MTKDAASSLRSLIEEWSKALGIFNLEKEGQETEVRLKRAEQTNWMATVPMLQDY